MPLSTAILTEDDVRAIRSLLWKGDLAQEAIGNKYGVSQKTVSAIKVGRLWPDVPWPNGRRGAIPASKNKEILLLRQRQSKARSKSTKGKSK